LLIFPAPQCPQITGKADQAKGSNQSTKSNDAYCHHARLILIFANKKTRSFAGRFSFDFVLRRKIRRKIFILSNKIRLLNPKGR